MGDELMYGIFWFIGCANVLFLFQNLGHHVSQGMQTMHIHGCSFRVKILRQSKATRHSIILQTTVISHGAQCTVL